MGSIKVEDGNLKRFIIIDLREESMKVFFKEDDLLNII